jgi:hypothetical protein
MGWTYSKRWQTSRELLDWYTRLLEQEGYTVDRSGHWFMLEDPGRGLTDLVYVQTAGNKRSGYGYKDISVQCGPYVYNAPVKFVKRVYPALKDDEYFKGWFAVWKEKHPESSIQNSI